MSGSQTQTALDLAVLLVMQMGQDGRGWVLHVGHARPLSPGPNHTKAFAARLSVAGFGYSVCWYRWLDVSEIRGRVLWKMLLTHIR